MRQHLSIDWHLNIPPKPWEVLRAVENKDIDFLMEVRDRAFHVRSLALHVPCPWHLIYDGLPRLSSVHQAV